MFKRKTIRIPRPSKEFEDAHYSSVIRNPWKEIEKLEERLDTQHRVRESLHQQLEEVYRRELLGYLSRHGVNGRHDSFSQVPRIERDGAVYIDLPEGWVWWHEVVGEHLYNPRPYSTLHLETPNGAVIAEYSSTESLAGRTRPFMNDDIFMASVNALRKLLEPPTGEREAAAGRTEGQAKA